MPRIQTTRTVTFALTLLRVYLIVMLVLILIGIWRYFSPAASLPVPAATHPTQR
jgi:hypothetical protein